MNTESEEYAEIIEALDAVRRRASVARRVYGHARTVLGEGYVFSDLEGMIEDLVSGLLPTVQALDEQADRYERVSRACSPDRWLREPDVE